MNSDPDYIPDDYEQPPTRISQPHLDRIVRKLHLSQHYAEVLARELKPLLAHGVKITGYRNRQAQFLPHFTLSDDMKYAFCNNVERLMFELGIEKYEPHKWRIFIDSNKTSLKAVLLYEDSTKKPVPIFYATDKEETYKTMKWVLNTVEYNRHLWRASCDLKVVTLLSGIQSGYTKNCCAYCRFDSRFGGNQYRQSNWESRTSYIPEQYNVVHPPLIDKSKILLPPLHIKLGIVKSFIKTLVGTTVARPKPRNEKAFKFLQETAFPKLSLGKIKEGEQEMILFFIEYYVLLNPILN